jgi:hypothetical protein
MIANEVSGGMDTTNPDRSVDYQQARYERQRAARRGVSAFAVEIHPDDLDAARRWRDEILEMLGITGAPTHRPGVCRACDGELPVWAIARRPLFVQYGFCSQRCLTSSEAGS